MNTFLEIWKKKSVIRKRDRNKRRLMGDMIIKNSIFVWMELQTAEKSVLI